MAWTKDVNVGRYLANHSALLFQYAVNSLIPLVLVPHVLRTIGLQEFGLLSFAFAIATYCALTVNYGFAFTAIPKIVGTTPGTDRARAVREILDTRLVLAGSVLVTVMVGTALAFATGRPPTAPQLLVLVALPSAAAINMAWFLQAEERFRAIAVASSISAVVALGLGFALVSPGTPHVLIFAALALVAAPLLAGVGTAFAALRGSDVLTVRRQRGGVRRELRDGRPFFVSQMVAALYGASGTIVIAAVAGSVEAGAYAMAERFVNAAGGACLLVHAAGYPALARLYREDRARYVRQVGFVAGTYLAMSLAICAAVALLWDPVLRYLFGAEAPARAPLLMVALAWLVTMVAGTLYTGYLTVAGRSRDVLPLTLRILALAMVVGIPAAFRWGAQGWVATLALTQAIVGLLVWRSLRSEARQSVAVRSAVDGTPRGAD